MDIKLIRFGPDGGQREVAVAKSLIIGRAENCDLRVMNKNISRYHCEIDISEGRVKLKDLGSSNGTFVNGKKVSETWLDAGSRINVGPFALFLQINGMPKTIVKTMTKTITAEDDIGLVGSKHFDTIAGFKFDESAAAHDESTVEDEGLAELLAENKKQEKPPVPRVFWPGDPVAPS